MKERKGMVGTSSGNYAGNPVRPGKLLHVTLNTKVDTKEPKILSMTNIVLKARKFQWNK